MAVEDVAVCVCTFRRPILKQTLASLAALDNGPALRMRIVIVDNDDTPSAASIAEDFKNSTAFPVTYVHAPSRNISIARNAGLDATQARYCAFIDDDELATPGWLSALLNVADESRAAAVLGPVRAVYDETSPSWMRAGDFHSTRPVWVGGEIVTGYTCNVLIDRFSPAAKDLRFELGRGRSGGEDTAFFDGLHAAGGSIGFAPDAWVEEAVSPARARFGWLAARRFRMGQTHGSLLRLRSSGFVRLARVAIAGAKAATCLAMAGACALSPVAWRRQLLRAILHVGTVCGVAGASGIVQYGGTGLRRNAEHIRAA